MRKLDPRKSLAQSVHRIAHRYLAQAIDLLEKQHLGLHESVHQARRNLKRVRALLNLVESADKPALKQIRKELASAAKSLSEFRDAAALVECAQKLGPYLQGRQGGEMAGPLIEAVERRRDLLALEAPPPQSLTAPAIAACRKALDDIDGSRLEKDKAASILAAGRRKNHDKARGSLERCRQENEPEAFHDLRKCGQATLFQAAFLSKAWPFAFEQEALKAKELTDILGHEHDIEVLNALLQAEPRLFDAIADKERLGELMTERRAALRHEAMKIAETLYAENGRKEEQRLAGLWALAAKA